MNWFLNLKLKYSLLIITIIIAFLVSFSTYKFNLYLALEKAKEDRISLVSQRAIELQGSIEALIRKYDLNEVKRIFGTLATNRELVHAFIINEKNKIILSTEKKLLNIELNDIFSDIEKKLFAKVKINNIGKVNVSSENKIIHAFFPISLGTDSDIRSSKTGYYHEEHDISKLIDDIIVQERMNAFIPVIFFLIALFAIGTFVYYRFTKRIAKIVKVTKECSNGKMFVKTEISGDDEIANLAKEFDLMIDKISNSQTLLKEYKRAIDESNIVSKSDLNGTITYVNNRFCEVTGFSRDEVIGKSHNIVRHADSKSETFKNLWTTIKAKKTWKGILKNRNKSGGYYFVDITIMPIIENSGEVREYIAIRHEITELIDSKIELEKLAQTDVLTGIGNRFKLINDVHTFNNPSLAMIDIDSFNEINDFYGYKFGDIVIKKFAKEIEELIPKEYNLYRLHGDEFAILVNNINRKNFNKFIEELNFKLSKNSIEINNKSISFQTTASISYEDKINLVVTADMAKKSAKKMRKHIIIYSDDLELNREYESNIEWTMKLKSALVEDRILPYYQPIFNNKTKKIEKYECLVRMIDTDGKIISPFFFLDIAKRSKQYLKLTKRVIDKSFEVFKNIDKEFSINLTAEDILSDELMNYLKIKIKDYNLNKKIVFELVESEGVDINNPKIIDFINKTKECGCKIAIDDFGTGYSNFEYLIKLSATYIKIDGSMIKNIDKDTDSEEIVKTIIDFAKKRNLKTIAEFVSSQKIFDKVNELGIDYSQGYFISEPKATL